jgi:hypothetical protein
MFWELLKVFNAAGVKTTGVPSKFDVPIEFDHGLSLGSTTEFHFQTLAAIAGLQYSFSVAFQRGL